MVTGASRGIGKGIALELGAAGATVYITGRSAIPGRLPGTVHATAAEIDLLGGVGVRSSAITATTMRSNGSSSGSATNTAASMYW